jgi:putative colanic acid biosynthesis UDP-glucose lipid carrier transferase
MQRNVLKTHATLFDQLLRFADPLWLVVAGLAAHTAYFPDQALPDSYLSAILAAAAICLATFPIAGLYRSQRGVSLAVELGALIKAWLFIAGCGLAFLFATKTGIAYSRVWSGLWVLFGFAGHALLRIGLRLALRFLRRRGYNLRHIAIVGANPLGYELARRLKNAPWSGFAIRNFYDDPAHAEADSTTNVRTAKTLAELAGDLGLGAIDQVWIAWPLKAEARIRALLTELQDYPVQVCFVPDIYGFQLLHHSFSEIAGLPVINLTDTPMHGWERLVKAIEDYLLSGSILLLASPLLLLIALGVKLSSPGPVFYRQERMTWNGSCFSMLKFRSMPVHAEAATGPVWAQAGEARATRFGAFLRRTSLDELPQLINVLRGEMSIVGPRPERPQFVDEFRKQIPGYMQKHLVKGGITGWAQVNDLRGNTDLAKRIQYDLYYIENWSLWFDLRILALTIVNIFTSRNAY